MGVPGHAGDLRFYEGDGRPIKVEIRPDTEPLELTGSTFTVTVAGDIEPTVTVEQVDDGADIFLTFTAAQQRAMPHYTQFDVAETGRWDQTLVRGRLVKVAEVT